MPRFRIVVEKLVTEVYEVEAETERQAIWKLENDEQRMPVRKGSNAESLGQIVATLKLPP